LNWVTPHLRSLAEQLVASETLRNRSSGTENPAAFHHVTERLRPHLATLLGSGGFRALLSRALVNAKAEVPWLRAVRVRANGVLEGLEELQPQIKPTEFREGQAVLLTHLLGLLVAFMGTSLTVRLMDEIWGDDPTAQTKSRLTAWLAATERLK